MWRSRCRCLYMYKQSLFYSAYHQLTDINNVTIMHTLYVLSLIIIACIIHVFFEFWRKRTKRRILWISKGRIELFVLLCYCFTFFLLVLWSILMKKCLLMNSLCLLKWESPILLNFQVFVHVDACNIYSSRCFTNLFVCSVANEYIFLGLDDILLENKQLHNEKYKQMGEMCATWALLS